MQGELAEVKGISLQALETKHLVFFSACLDSMHF